MGGFSDSQPALVLVGTEGEAQQLLTQTRLFTTPHLLQQLKQMTEGISSELPELLSLLMVELDGCQDLISEAVQNKLIAELKDSARGLDWVDEYFMAKYAIVMPQTGKRGASALRHLQLLDRLGSLAFEGHDGSIQKLQVHISTTEYNGCRHYEDLLSQTLQQLQMTQNESPSSLKLV